MIENCVWGCGGVFFFIIKEKVTLRPNEIFGVEEKEWKLAKIYGDGKFRSQNYTLSVRNSERKKTDELKQTCRTL